MIFTVSKWKIAEAVDEAIELVDFVAGYIREGGTGGVLPTAFFIDEGREVPAMQQR